MTIGNCRGLWMGRGYEVIKCGKGVGRRNGWGEQVESYREVEDEGWKRVRR